MKNDHKSKLMDVWDRIKADAKMDNTTKAKIAEETVQEAVTGLQEAVNPERFFCANPNSPFEGPENAVKETRVKSLSADYELAEYREATPEENGKKHSGKLFILRKRS
nr:hypothetical protein [uncultured Oscillibacter sp.]